MDQHRAILKPHPLRSIGHLMGVPNPQAGIDPLVHAALDAAPVGLIVLDDRLAVILLTACAARLLGCGADPEGALAALLDRSSALAPASVQHLLSAMAVCTDSRETVVTVPTVGGGTLAADVRRAGSLGWVLSLSDVTETRQTQDWLLEHVSSDPVTGLWNRHRFMLMLEDALLRSTATGGQAPSAVLGAILIGLDVCGPADPAGLQAGDMLFRMASERLSRLLRDTDMFARFSENEFALALTRPDGRHGIEAFTASVHEILCRPFMLEGRVTLPGCHIGIACAPADGAGSEDLMAHARLALHASRAAPSGPIRFFEPRMLERAQQMRSLEADLRGALNKQEFELHYQPQVDVMRGVVTGLEALIRWRSPDRGLVPPIEFIPLAERFGMINEIGAWVLHEACRQAVSWPDSMTVAINASPLQFETGHFAQAVADVLHETGLPPDRLEVEITESLLLHDTGAVMNTLSALQDLGVRLVLDDFGTGYASLSQLSRFKFDKIKIDRSFVSPDDGATQNSVIVRSIAALGHGLGIPITAEGVETETQLDQIKADGCTCVQGYYFSRPVPAADIGSLLGRLHRPAMAVAC